MRAVRQFVSLASLTALEAVRQPLCLLLAATAVGASALTPMLLLHAFGEDGKLARDSSLACHFVFGLFIAGYASCTSLAREIRAGTALAVLSKPVGRDLFFLAKFAGVAAVVAGFSACATAATLLSERVAERFVFSDAAVGYFTDWQTGWLLLGAPLAALLAAGLLNAAWRQPFTSTAFGLLLIAVLAVFFAAGFFDRQGRPGPFDFRVDWRLVPASLLIAMALVVLCAIALSLSTRLDTVPVLTICGVVFLLGLMSDFLFGRFADASGTAGLLYRLVPNWQHFWAADALTGGGVIPWAYVLKAGGYAAACAAGVLGLGLMSFRGADLT